MFQNGIEIDEVFETKTVTYPYFGRLEEIDFLERLYNLETMESDDPRYENAIGDIIQHTINNDDYPYCWVFMDERFQLLNGSDEVYLKFLCEVFHPEVRNEKRYWKDLLAGINNLLRHDGYEIYPGEKISNRDVYNWRLYQQENEMFIPFSLRNKKAIKEKQVVLKIKRDTRSQIYRTFERHDYKLEKFSETGLTFWVSVTDEVLYDIGRFYTPKCYKENHFVETDSLKDFTLFTSPYYVLDAIEFFGEYCDSDFTAEINAIFNLNDISLKLSNGKIESIVDSHITNGSLASIGEAGLKELLQEASRYYEKEDLTIAVEKLWDALERLKTYYSPTLDKKKSVNRIIEDMSGNETPFKEIFDNEFRVLTTIGNDFRIRHHETTKVDIQDERHYDYFYKRCLSLITTATRYLDI